MTQEQMNALASQLGTQASEQIKTEVANLKSTMEANMAKFKREGSISKGDYEKEQKALQTAIETVKTIAEKQGKTLTELESKLSSSVGGTGMKSLHQLMDEDAEEIKTIRSNGFGNKQYLLRQDVNGNVFAERYDRKAQVPHAHQTVGGSSGTDTFVPAVTTGVNDIASVIRLANQNNLVNQYRNTPFVFDLVNVIPTSMNTQTAQWWEELTVQGGSSTVAEGTVKPIAQYQYEFKMSPYKKEAVRIGFSDEFRLDFGRIQHEALTNGRKDLYNKINNDILADVKSKATALSITSGNPFYQSVLNPNTFDIIAGMASQVDGASFGGALANGALMSTGQKYFTGITKDLQGGYMNRPDVLSNIAMIGNKAILDNDLLVGDFTKYNVMMRGGIIVKVGYATGDWESNKFSVLLEQYYFNYIPTIHTEAIVKSEITTAKTAIEVQGG